MAEDRSAVKAVELLVKLASLDTVHRDIYLKRGRELLSSTLDESAYRAIGSSEKEINELTASSRSAVLQRDWQQAAELSARVARLREHIATTRNLGKLGAEVYDADPVAFEPLSPGKHLGTNAQANQAVVRGEALAALASLAKLDSGLGAFYEQRRSYFSGLELATAAGAAEKRGQSRSRAEVERLAVQAAESGDAGALERLAKELRDWKETGSAAVTVATPGLLSRYEPPVDLKAPFPPQAAERARRLGLVETHATPMAEFAKVREVIYTHIDQPAPASAEMEREGVLRARVQAESHLPADLATEEARVLASQFLEQIFLNSGGAR